MLLAAALLALLAATPPPAADPCAPGSARAQIAAEIESLRQEASGVVPQKDVEPDWKEGLSLLDQAAQALEKGRPYLALDRLSAARLQLRPLRYYSAHARDPKNGIDALRRDLRSLPPELKRASSGVLPLAVRAFRDEARVQAPVYGDTLPAWDEIDSAQGALFYGAQGIELARIAAFDAALHFPLPPEPPRLAPTAVAQAVDAYERTLVAAYKPPLSADRHRDFILASAALKSAREILAAGSAEGALWNYLKARRYGFPITRASLPTPSLADLRKEAATADPAAGSGDRTLACRLREQVGFLLEGTEVAEERLRTADALLHDLLPEHDRLLRGGAMAKQAATPGTSSPAVTVTLVRWPYT